MRYLSGLPLLFCSALCTAQVYTWVDAEGHKHYSDQAPSGAMIQKIKINAATGPAAAGTPAKQESLAEKEAGFKQRLMDKADAEKKAAEKSKQDEEKRSYCADLKGHLAGLKQNARLVSYSEDGKKQVLGADARQAEVDKTKRAIEENCKD